MIRELAKSIREYKKASIMTPIWVALEVVLECIIPFIMAMLVNQILSLIHICFGLFPDRYGQSQIDKHGILFQDSAAGGVFA